MDKKDLLKRRDANKATREVELSVIEPGEEPIVVIVRALTREEVKECTGTANAKSEKDLEKIDRNMAEINMISKALVDPEMTPEDVIEWLRTAPGGDSVRVMDAVSDLSGMNEDAGKRNLQNVRRGGRRRK